MPMSRPRCAAAMPLSNSNKPARNCKPPIWVPGTWTWTSPTRFSKRLAIRLTWDTTSVLASNLTRLNTPMLMPTFSFQHGTSGLGSTPLSGTTNPNLLTQEEIYNWYVAGLSLNYNVTKRFTVGCSYQFTGRTSSLPNRGYNQNI